ncbi:MAG: DNA recombination protein RmuC [Ignavibacteria bacterium]|nr:DNA recombination protein RmuC [Ignavibacteria bacterium]
METILIVFIVVLLFAVFFLLWKKTSSPSTENASSLVMMQQQVESLRTEFQRSFSATSESLAQSLNNTTQLVQQQLAQVTNQLGTTTQNMNQQLSAIAQQMQTQTGTIGTRLDTAAKVIGDVQKNLGELGKVALEMKDVGINVAQLSDLLRAPKFRGGFGEALLEDMLKQVLPNDGYDVQYRFRNGQQVDAVIHTSGGKVPIDSKFPLENFRKFTETDMEQERKLFRKQFLADVKKHIDAIAAKYILTDEGTLNFALMYIPAENVYYETIIKDEFNDSEGLLHYASKKHVIPVSPNSFYAYLQVIALGLKGMKVEKTAKQILDSIHRLGNDFEKVRETFDILGSHLENARKKYDESDKKLKYVEERFSGITSVSLLAGETTATMSLDK